MPDLLYTVALLNAKSSSYLFGVELLFLLAGAIRIVLAESVSAGKTRCRVRTWKRPAARTTAPISAATMASVCAASANVRRGTTPRSTTAACSASVTTSTVTAPTTSSVEVLTALEQHLEFGKTLQIYHHRTYLTC